MTLPSHLPQRSKQELLALRQRILNPALSLSYQQPLHIVRGAGAYLFDEDGQAYLDMVNNVAHVGHCHAHVVQAAQAQMQVLNTNTRYLHEHIVRYAEMLTAHLPAPLSVVFLTNSGSEANDLALRIARTASGGHDCLVLEHAYHGNSPSMIEMSPYKFNGRGGRGCAPHIQMLPLPDLYRGQFLGPHALEQYLAAIDQALLAIQSRGQSPAALFAESIAGCGGQVVLADGYLSAAYAKVRAAGGLCVADEVQTGFGRVGSHFWAFQQHDVIPDIVTMGKPIGNGHPMGAVVTTAEIAAKFQTGMEYFNTFGGNPVSCATGIAVLEVIQQEGLQAHALAIGEQLLQGMRELQKRFTCLGDVRGSGLFLGLDIVQDPASASPAPALARAIVEAMKQQHILLSTDGPFDNVIKIKPPMVFSTADASQFLNKLESALTELAMG